MNCGLFHEEKRKVLPLPEVASCATRPTNMEASTLCETIFSFMGQGQGVSEGVVSTRLERILPIQNGLELSGNSNTQTTEDPPQSFRSAEGADIIGCTTESEGKGVMLAIFKNKLGDYNMRGVVAGMDLLDMVKRDSSRTDLERSRMGKALNTRHRRRQRGTSGSPYSKETLGRVKGGPLPDQEHVATYVRLSSGHANVSKEI